MNIRQKWASSIMPKNDALNVKMWTLDNEKSIFFGKIKILMWICLSTWEFKLYGNCNACWNGAIMVKYQWT
jgi:hypothetical protein